MSGARDRRPRRASLAATALALLGGALPSGCGAREPAARHEASGPFRALSYEAALEAARAEQKLVLVDFFTTWCPPCRKLDRETWPDPRVASWLGERTVALKVDAEKEAALARRYRVEVYPTIVIARADGSEIDRILGFLPPEQFVAEAEARIERAQRVERMPKPPR